MVSTAVHYCLVSYGHKSEETITQRERERETERERERERERMKETEAQRERQRESILLMINRVWLFKVLTLISEKLSFEGTYM